MPAVDYDRLAAKAAGQSSDLLSSLAKRRKDEAAAAQDAEMRSRELDRLLAAPGQDGGFSFGDAAKRGASAALSGLDYLGTIARSGIREIAETAGLKENTVGVSALDVLRGRENARSAVQNMRATLGIDPNAGGRWAGLLDTVGMVATDPLSAVTLGTSTAAKTALGTVARSVGDDVAEAVAKSGVRAGDDILAQRAAQLVPAPANDILSQAVGRPVTGAFGPVPTGGPSSVREVLAESANVGLANRSLDDVVGRQLRVLDRGARGGIGFAGRQTGIGSVVAGRAGQALRGAPGISQLRQALVPTAAVSDAFGRPAADAVDIAIHTGGNARREAYNRLRAGVSDVDADKISDDVRRIMVTDLAELAPSLVGQGVEYGGRLVAQPVKDALEATFRKPPGQVLAAIDGAVSAVKRLTTASWFNPTHVPRNITSNKLFAALYGGVYNPKYYTESGKLRKALVNAPESARRNSGKPLEDALRGAGLSDQEAGRALALHDEQLVGRGGSLFDDIDVADPLKQRTDPFGTKAMTKLNSWDEEITRGAVFLKKLDDGLDPRLAAQQSRRALLDYSSEGLTPFERDVLQRAIFFFKFPRRAIPRGVEFAARYPALAADLVEAGSLGNDTRNQYGEIIGAFVDNPLEATIGSLGDLAATAGGLGLVEGDTLGMANPLIKFALDENSRNVADLLPPVGMVQRDIESLTSPSGGGVPEAIGGEAGLGGLVGLRAGKDWGAERFAEDMAQRVAERGEPSPLDLLILAARDAGVEQPYDMGKVELVQEMAKRGVPRNRLAALIGRD